MRYKEEAFKLFVQMQELIRQDLTKLFFRVQIQLQILIICHQSRCRRVLVFRQSKGGPLAIGRGRVSGAFGRKSSACSEANPPPATQRAIAPLPASVAGFVPT